MVSRPNQHEIGESEIAAIGDRETAAAYVAALSSDLAAIARRHGLDALGYILDMARLEAENVSGAPLGNRSLDLQCTVASARVDVA